MSRDMVVLVPNGRRVKVHCTADTSILQVLEDVCTKQGFQPSEYDLKHHNTILDLTTTIRFCNLPNKAMLEMVETDRKRIETNVTIGLTLKDGERRTGDFPPCTSLFEMIMSLAPEELPSLEHPSILYMRQEVTGLEALKEKTLRQLGLITGRAILRLLNKTEAMQANVSKVYRRPQIEKQVENHNINVPPEKKQHCDEPSFPGPSGIHKKSNTVTFNPIEALKQEQLKREIPINEPLENEDNTTENTDMKMEVDMLETNISETSSISTKESQVTCPMSQEKLERHLRIEEEVVFLGAQKAIAFMQPDEMEDESHDLPDDFYDLTIEEVRKIYHDLREQRIKLENTPLMTSSQKANIEKQFNQEQKKSYKNVVVRIQFPDHMILQGIFPPTKTIEDVMNFVKQYLHNPNKPFVIFTTPLKEPLNPSTTLLEAKFVPCVHMHFKWSEENSSGPYLKDEIYLKKTSSDAASILASKYRAPSRNTEKQSNQVIRSDEPSSASKQNKVPKWFKK
ncbi:tether containing UBX domain for GLUT4 [Battus philenor]|uniref:tether containing UBX domain for GLUT4 n=1 Tax=Battus philenor TaxID=42288 RepID=UPI0035D01054